MNVKRGEGLFGTIDLTAIITAVMKEATPELSPDLEWMLQGRQASPALILETMVHEYTNEVTRLTAAILGDPSLALYAAFDTFAAVLENRHRYYGKTSVRLFIFSYAVKISRHYLAEAREPTSPQLIAGLSPKDETDAVIGSGIAGLKDDLKIPLILHLGARLTEDEMALVLKTRPERVRAKIHQALRTLEKNLPTQTWAGQSLPDMLGAYLERCSQPPDLGEITQAQMIQAVEYALEKKKQTSQWRALLNQLAMAFGVVFSLVAIGWITNRIASRQSPPPLVAQTVIVTQIVKVPVYVTPTPRMRKSGTLLSLESSEEEIRQRILESDSLWNTLWADVLLYDYGPVGYVGRPDVHREQIWISQPYRGLLISGSLTGEVEKSWLLSETRLYPLLNLVPQYLYYPTDYFANDVLHAYLIFQPKSWARAGTRISIVEKINTLGRDALVVDVRSEDGLLLGRITVDAELGLILAVRLYDRDQVTVRGDVYLNKLALDVDLPEFIFDSDLQIKNFFTDYRARQPDRETLKVLNVAPPGHEPLPKINPPDGFDPSGSRLAFQWSDHTFGQDLLVFSPVDVFADGYYLGQIQISNPWDAICERSPDGDYLAIVEQPETPPFPSTRMRWLKLDNLEDDHELLPKGSLYGSYFAFSPDSRYLAFWGCGGREDNCGVYLLDFNNQKLKKLLAGGYAGYFVWRPDGDELAMLRTDDTLIVVDVDTAKITYREYMDWITFIVPPNAPLKDWGVEFPPPRMGLQDCALPGSN